MRKHLLLGGPIVYHCWPRAQIADALIAGIATLKNDTASTGGRLVSLDQFRGYTVAGMFLVNFLGDYAAIPEIFKHHGTYFSYADTIMPQFFFAVGFAYRLTFLRGLEKNGAWPTYRHAIMRNLGLILLGAVFYNLDGRADTWEALKSMGVYGFLTTAFRSNFFEALTHIGVTGLWVLPVIGARTSVYLAFMAVSAAVHLALSYGFYFDWAQHIAAIDGGPLGFMSWTLPTLMGAWACDVVRSRGARKALAPMAGWAAMLMLAGYALACVSALRHTVFGIEPVVTGWARWFAAPPFVPPIHPHDMWTMDQLAGSVSYMTFSAGFSLLVYAGFAVACDIGTFNVGVFRTLGTNALFAYIAHYLVMESVTPYVPRDCPLWFALFGFSIFFVISYLFVRHLEKHDIYIRL